MAREREHGGPAHGGHAHGEPLPAGVHDLTPPPPPRGKDELPPPEYKPTGYWRVRVWLTAHPEPGAPDHTVEARDEVQAEAQAYKELGIRSVDKSVNSVEIVPASEGQYLQAQAKRLGVDLRTAHDAEGKLTWAPPGHKLSKTYYVSKAGTLSDKKEEED